MCVTSLQRSSSTLVVPIWPLIAEVWSLGLRTSAMASISVFAPEIESLSKSEDDVIRITPSSSLVLRRVGVNGNVAGG